MVEFRVLGPLEAVGPSGPVTLGGGKLRLLLAVLIMRADEFVPRNALIDALWPEAPPTSAAQSLESYVSRLRTALRAAGVSPETLTSVPGGYRLARDGNRFDHEQFVTLSDRARAALVQGDHDVAGALATQALTLWRGPALAGMAEERAIRGDAVALEDRRLSTVEIRAAANLESGRNAEVIAELSAEAVRHPTRERIHELLMLALYRAGRQTEALAVYQDARHHLDRELGLEPGLDLQMLQARILRHDRSLDRPEQTGSSEFRQGTAVARPVVQRDPRASRRLMAAVALLATILGVLITIAIVLSLVIGQGDSAAIGRTLRGPGLGVFNETSGHPLFATALAGVPTSLTNAFGSVWATSYDAGTLMRIDSRESAVIQTVPIGTGASGVAAAAGDLWVANSLADQLDRVNAGTDDVVERIQVGSDPTDVGAGAGSIWVANTADGTVSRIDPMTGHVVNTIPVGPSPDGVAVGDGSVWVSLGGTDSVARMDPRSGTVAQLIPVGSGPSAIAVGPAGVWVANRLDSTVSLIDPRSDAVVLTRAVSGAPEALAASGASAWIAGGTSQITLLSSTGQTTMNTTPSPVDALAVRAGKLLVGVVGTGADHRGGTLQARISDPAFERFDPAACCDIPANLLGLSYDGLLAVSKSPSDPGRLVPDLALAIPAAQDGGLSYTFRLRPGLRYWTGQPVRASDFMRGFERAAEESTWAAYLSALPHASACPNTRSCNLSTAIQANNRAGTVTLRLTHRDPNLLTALAESTFAPDPGGPGIRPGTGPYRPVRQVVGHLIVFERNPYFHEWSAAAQPSGYPDRIAVRVDGTPSADVAAVAAGRADWTFDSPTERQLAEIELRSPGLLHRYQALGTEWADLNTRRLPFKNLRARQALNYAINREAIVRMSGGSQLAAPQCQIIPPTMPGYVPYCPYTSQPSASGRWTAPDLTRARQLIAASGTAGQSVTVLSQPSPDGQPVATYVVGLLRRLGYRAHLRVTDTHALLDSARQDEQLNLDSWVAGVPSPSEWLTLQLSCAEWHPPTAVVNHAQFCDPVLDRTAAEAAQLQATDPVAADRLWAKADREATNQAPWLMMISFQGIDTVSARVGDYQYVPTYGALLDQLWLR